VRIVKDHYRAKDFDIIEIDGCEYLILERDRNNPHEGFGFMSHKGNCKNSIHYHNLIRLDSIN